MRTPLVIAAGFVSLLVFGVAFYYSQQNEAISTADKVTIETVDSPEVEQFSIEVFYLNTGNNVFIRNADSSITRSEKIGFRATFPNEMGWLLSRTG